MPDLTRLHTELENVATWYKSNEDFDKHLIQYDAQVLKRNSKGGRVLEVGCSSGVLTEKLINFYEEVYVVEGSKTYFEYVKKKFKKCGNIKIYFSLVENFSPHTKFNEIVLAHLLEHLDDPVKQLKRVKKWLYKDGVIHICVPNANSLHRRIGKIMGLISRLDELHLRDIKLGHKRVYTKEGLFTDISKAGLTIERCEGVFLKPLSNEQMKNWHTDLLDALFIIGQELPDYCAEIYVKCKL